MFLENLLLLSFIGNTVSVSFLVNRFTADLESAYLCPDNDKLEIPMKLIRIDRLNRTHRAITMEFSFAHAVDDTSEGTYFIERFVDGGWKSFPGVPFQKDVCKTLMKYSKDSMVRLGKVMGMERPGTCPIPAGNYSVKRWPFELHFETPFWPGRYRFQTVWRRIATKQKIFCSMSVINFVEIVE